MPDPHGSNAPIISPFAEARRGRRREGMAPPRAIVLLCVARLSSGNVPAWENLPLTRAATSPRNGSPTLPRQVYVPLVPRIVPPWENPLPASTIASPNAGRCGKDAAQRLGLGELSGFGQRMRAILPQRPGMGEMALRKISRWERRREGPNRLPAETSDPLPVRKGGSLPRRDDVQIRAIFDARKAEILPSKDDAPLALRNVPAWENSKGRRS